MQASSTTHIYCLIRQYGSDGTCPTRNNYNSKKYTNDDWPRDAHFGISAVTHFFILLKFTGFWTFAQEVSAVKPCYTVTRCSAIFFRADFVLCDVVCIQVLLFMLAAVSLRIKPVRLETHTGAFGAGQVGADVTENRVSGTVFPKACHEPASVIDVNPPTLTVTVTVNTRLVLFAIWATCRRWRAQNLKISGE